MDTVPEEKVVRNGATSMALSVCNARHVEIFTAVPYNVSLYCPFKHLSLAMIFVLLAGHDFTYTKVL